jgi:CheY-like chemotaxis protein
MVRSSIAMLLRPHSVLEAENGRVALNHFHTHKPHVVITDLMMPEMDGLELIGELLKANPVPRIIAMSANGNNLAAARQLGVTNVLPKPFRGAELLQAVEEALAT